MCPLPPDKLAQAIALSHWRTGLYFGGTAWVVVALWLLVRLRRGGRLRGRRSGCRRGPGCRGWWWRRSWLLILTGIELPLALLGHHVSLKYGLSIEAWGAWWVDWAKSTALTVVVGTAIRGGSVRADAAFAATLVAVVLDVHRAGGGAAGVCGAAGDRSHVQPLYAAGQEQSGAGGAAGAGGP